VLLSLLAVVGAVVGYLLLGTTPDTDARRTVANGWMAVAPLVAGVAVLVVSRRIEPAGRRAWRLLAAGALSWAGGQALFTLAQLRTAEVPFPGPADVGFLGAVPLLVLGMLAYPTAGRGSLSRARLALDAVVVTSSLLLASLLLVVGPYLGDLGGEGTSWALVIGAAYPVTDVAVLSVAILTARRSGRHDRAPLLLVTAAMTGLVVADTAFALGTATGGYTTGQWSDAGWVAGYLLLWPAAVAYRDGPRPTAEEGEEPGLVTLVPYVAVAVGLAALLVRVVQGQPTGVVPAVVAATMVLALVVRQALAVLDASRLTQEVARREEYFRSIVQGSSDIMTILEPDLRIRWQSPSVARVLGTGPAGPDDPAAGGPPLSLADVVHPADLPHAEEVLARALSYPDETAGGLLEVRMRDAAGRWRHTESTLSDQRRHPVVRGIVMHTRDVTERRELQQRLSDLAFTDSLTGLANRRLFLDRLEEAVRDQAAGHPGAVIALDLDGFKSVNDMFGHDVGDRLLIEVGRRIRGGVPGHLASRLGGDEFAVLVRGTAREAYALASQLVLTLAAPYPQGDGSLQVSASIGVAGVEAATEAISVLRNADLALRHAKQQGKNRVERYRPGLHVELLERLSLEQDLGHALDRRQFRLAYQPLVTLPGRTVVGAEALLRWEHPSRGTVQPKDFVGVLEEVGLIGDVGRWVIDEACAQLARWLAAGHDLRVSLNVSVRQLQEHRLLSDVDEALHRHGVPAERLMLEITESVLLVDAEAAISELDLLHEAGVRIALDDFGTGYSSLSYLQRMPVDVLKIDRDFVTGLASAEPDDALTTVMVGLGERLSIGVVAEGVENETQAAGLVRIGCRLGQGYLFGRPGPPERVDALLGRPPWGGPAPRPPVPLRRGAHSAPLAGGGRAARSGAADREAAAWSGEPAVASSI